MQDMDSTVRDDYLWLLSESALPVLNQTEKDFRDKVNALTINKRLRKSISPTRAAIVIEQTLLRQRAKAKFERANELFSRASHSNRQPANESLVTKPVVSRTCHRLPIFAVELAVT